MNEWRFLEIRSYWVLENGKFYQTDIELYEKSYKCISTINEIHIDTGKCKRTSAWKNDHNKLIKSHYHLLRFSDIVPN